MINYHDTGKLNCISISIIGIVNITIAHCIRRLIQSNRTPVERAVLDSFGYMVGENGVGFFRVGDKKREPKLPLVFGNLNYF